MIRQEIDTESRVIFTNEFFIALAPSTRRVFHSKHGFFPASTVRRLRICWRLLRQPGKNQCARFFRALDAALAFPSYNYVVHTSPVGEEINDHYHWHIEMMPKLTKVAGFEWGTGFYINPTPPEEAARFLRDAR